MSSGEIIQTSAGPCRVRRSRRRTLAISVLPGGEVELSAPRGATLAVLRDKVARRLRWITAQRQDFAELNRTRLPLRYVSGATHCYLGRQYRLKIHLGASPGVRLVGACLHVTVAESGEATVQAALAAWYRVRAADQFARRLARWAPWCRTHRLPAPQLRLLRMPKRWGSAHRNGRICLNPDLIRAPSACVDYVIAHEVCHLRHPRHDREFFLLLDHMVPTWRHIKRRLESFDL